MESKSHTCESKEAFALGSGDGVGWTLFLTKFAVDNETGSSDSSGSKHPNGLEDERRDCLGESKPLRSFGQILLESRLSESNEKSVSPDDQPPRENEKNPDDQWPNVDSKLTSSKITDFGESSFSRETLIMHPEPISHPGSISKRSDSNISGRSFAFPILQPEWNSSPVKMAKPESRHLKQRGWRSSFFCCRF